MVVASQMMMMTTTMTSQMADETTGNVCGATEYQSNEAYQNASPYAEAWPGLKPMFEQNEDN